jgi:hypothetical protein
LRSLTSAGVFSEWLQGASEKCWVETKIHNVVIAFVATKIKIHLDSTQLSQQHITFNFKERKTSYPISIVVGNTSTSTKALPSTLSLRYLSEGRLQ